MLPDSPALVACPNCNAYLWIASLKPLGQLDTYRTQPEDQEIPGEWKDAPEFRTPDAEDIARALDAGLADTVERERELRISLWWSRNDRHRGHEERDEIADDPRFHSNLDRLASLLDESANDTLLRAEIARESSDFRRAIELCDALVAMDPKAHLKEIAVLIRTRALPGDARVFRLDSTEA